jgi:Rad3-related DNA helicase
MAHDLLAHFPPGFTPRPEQRRLLSKLASAIEGGESVILVEAPPGIGKSHIAMTLARWSGDAYLLTSQKLLQDQYERDFGEALQIVKGRDNYLCELYPASMGVTTSRGKCQRPRGPACRCPYVRAKAAAMAGPIFCANTAYFATLRQWHGEQLRRRRLLLIDEAHNLEAQLVSVFSVSFSPAQMRDWFGGPLPRLDDADGYRELLEAHLDRLRDRLESLRRTLDDPVLADLPPSPEEQDLQGALDRIRFFLDAPTAEWAVRYPAEPGSALDLLPLTIAPMARDLLFDAADLTVLSSAYLGHRAVLAECFGLPPDGVRTIGVDSPFPLAQRPIIYRPVGALSKQSLPALLPAIGAEVAAILAAHAGDKGLIHAPSYAAARRLRADLDERAPGAARRIIFVDSSAAKARALEQHRASRLATVLLSPSMREGIDLPDDFLRFQIITKMPYPDLGDPWTAARHQRDPRWYAVETAKALVQAYGRGCRHAGDHGTTYVLDGQFQRFLTRYRPLLPAWFLDAAQVALAAHRATPRPVAAWAPPCDHPALFVGRGPDLAGLPCPRCHRWIDRSSVATSQ